MGFPLCYSELLLLPKLLLHILFFLGFVRRLIASTFNLLGLGDLLDSDDQSLSSNIHHHNNHHQHHQLQSVSAMLIQKIVPVCKFTDLSSSITDSCAVCLYEFKAEDEVRRLSNCRHVYHKSCLDRWMEHDQQTCPLCRMPLVPEEMQEAFNDKIWAAAWLLDSDIFSYAGEKKKLKVTREN